MLTGERLGAKPLEMRDELLALREEAPLGENARADTALDAFHEPPVLLSDLVVEGEQLVDPRLVDVRSEEIVEEPGGAFGTDRQDRAARQIRLPGEHVDPEVRPEEMELAPRNLSSREERVAVSAQRAELARDEAVRLEPVRVRRDVDRRGKARVGDCAVVTLEEVLAGDLPVCAQLEFAPEAELERLDVKDLRELRGNIVERVGEWGRVRVGIDEDERPPRLDLDRREPQLVRLEARLPARARRCTPA